MGIAESGILQKVWVVACSLLKNGFFRVVNLFGEDNIGILWTLAAWGDSGKEASLERISGKKKSPPFDMDSTMLLLYNTLKL